MYMSITAVGNVSKKPEMKYTPSGQAVCNFSLAVNRQYTAANGEHVKETIWLRVSTFGKTAEVVNQYVDKGSKILIEARLTPDKSTGGPRIWTNQAGEPQASYEVVAQNVRFLSAKSEQSEQASQFTGELPPEDDIPF